jgi:hypothetical protein
MATPAPLIETFFVEGPDVSRALRLPIPPEARDALVLFVIVAASLAVALVVAGVTAAMRKPASDIRDAFAFAILGCGLVLPAGQRADDFHLFYAGATVVPLALRALAPQFVRIRSAPLRPVARATAGVLGVAILSLTIPPLLRDTLALAGVVRESERIAWNGRAFPVDMGTDVGDTRAVLADVQRHMPGRLIVGPRDMGRTWWTDTYLYYLLPSATPSTYHLEMVVGAANNVRSRLAADVASADVLVLTDRYDAGYDHYTSARPSDVGVEAVITQQFVPEATYGHYTVYVRR